MEWEGEGVLILQVFLCFKILGRFIVGSLVLRAFQCKVDIFVAE